MRWRPPPSLSSKFIFPTFTHANLSVTIRIFPTSRSAWCPVWAHTVTNWRWNTRCATCKTGLPMDLRKLKKLIDLVEASGIAELEITEGEEKVRIAKSIAGAPMMMAQDHTSELQSPKDLVC